MISFLPRIKTFGDLSVVATHGLSLSRRFQQKKHKSSSNRMGGAMNPPSKPSERPIHPIFLRSAPAAKTKSGRFFVTLLPIRFFRPRKENVRLRQTQQHKYSREQPAPQENDADAACTTFAAAPRFPPADLRISKKKGRCHSLHRPFPFIKTVIESS